MIMDDLRLDRTLIVFDLETTGTNINTDRIVEIGALIIEPNGKQSTYHTLVNPEMEIPKGASDVHGITNEDVKDAPTFNLIASELFNLFNPADLCGYNSNQFDVPLFVNELFRCGFNLDLSNRRLIDAFYIFKTHERRDLSSAYKFYCNANLENAHTAMADLTATFEILREQARRYNDLEWNMDVLHKASRNSKQVDIAGKIELNDNGEPCITFGKHKGKTIKQISIEDNGWLQWLMSADFSKDTKNHIVKALNS